MNLDESQRSKIAGWIADGLKLSEIQKRIGSELGLTLTYMEVRLLVDDLKLTPKDPEPPKPATLAAPSPLAPDAPAGNPPLSLQPEAATLNPVGGVSVTVDQMARPGTMVSGKVTFSDGQDADWYLDQTGRLGVVPKQQGYKPAPADVQAFQLALQNELAKLGF